MDISALKRNDAQVQDGRWVDDLPGMGDVRLRVRGMSSDMFMRRQTEKQRALPRDERNDDGTPTPKAASRILRELLAEVVLLEWDGFTENGRPMAYSAERARELLLNPDMMPFADAVAYAAGVVDRARAYDVEEDAGN